jgi:hypothetical protein
MMTGILVGYRRSIATRSFAQPAAARLMEHWASARITAALGLKHSIGLPAVTPSPLAANGSATWPPRRQEKLLMSYVRPIQSDYVRFSIGRAYSRRSIDRLLLEIK